MFSVGWYSLASVKMYLTGYLVVKDQSYVIKIQLQLFTPETRLEGRTTVTIWMGKSHFEDSWKGILL